MDRLSILAHARLLLLCIIIVLEGAGAAKGAYLPTWQSLDARSTPEWYQDAKFGIFIHWGVYSVPSFGALTSYAEWYGWSMFVPGSDEQAFHNKTYGPNFKYSEFAPMFTCELFDPNAWADLFVRSGARYIVPTSKHHEGFTIWPSAVSWNWNAVDIGPKRDLLGDLMTAVRSKGLHTGAYFSLYEWFHPLYRGPDPSLYVKEIMLPQMYDLVSNYRPEVLWTDGDWERNSTFWNATGFLAWLFNESPVKDIVVVNDRWGSETRGHHGGIYTAEYSSEVWLNHTWEQNSAIQAYSYGYNRNTPIDQYNSVPYLLDLLTRTVAYGGNLLLDIGPARDGTIPSTMQERLLQIGDWLSVNGVAIYNTRMWRVQEETIFPGGPVTYKTLSGTSNVFNLCENATSPHCNTATTAMVFLTNNQSHCEDYCSNNQSCLSYTWFGPSVPLFALGCFVHTDNAWSPVNAAGVVSAQKKHWTVRYTFNPQTKNVYTIISPWPPATFVISSAVATNMTEVSLVGYGKLVVKSQPGHTGLVVFVPSLVPDDMPCDYAYSFELKGVL